LNNEYTLKMLMTGRQNRSCLVVGEGWVNREDEGGLKWWMYFVYRPENRIMKLVEIILRRGEGG
jgi:hypothetical protein